MESHIGAAPISPAWKAGMLADILMGHFGGTGQIRTDEYRGCSSAP